MTPSTDDASELNADFHRSAPVSVKSVIAAVTPEYADRIAPEARRSAASFYRAACFASSVSRKRRFRRCPNIPSYCPWTFAKYVVHRSSS